MNLKVLAQVMREFLMTEKLRYEKAGLIPTLDLLIEELDDVAMGRLEPGEENERTVDDIVGVGNQMTPDEA